MHDPLTLFKAHWQQAKAAQDANANYCSLATVSDSGAVSIRTLVLRAVTDDAFVIFINDTSPKWADLSHANPFELLIFWPSLMQQYRVRGECLPIPAEEMRSHWARKPYTSKIIDHFYTRHQAQSSVIASRQALLSGIHALQAEYPDNADNINGTDIPFPDNAKGIQIKANTVEAWLGSAADRLHDRCLYTLQDGQWDCQTLVP